MKLPFTGLEVALADDWKKLKTRGTVLFATAMAALQILGPELRDWWENMPDDIKSVIPANFQSGIKYAILFLMIIALRYTTVRKMDKTNDPS